MRGLFRWRPGHRLPRKHELQALAWPTSGAPRLSASDGAAMCSELVQVTHKPLF